MQTQLSLATVYDVVDYINQNAKTSLERGIWWEKAVVYYLRHDPEMHMVMGDVRLWADAPTNDEHDTGIDVVRKYNGSTPDGSKRHWAVQCKYYGYISDENDLVANPSANCIPADVFAMGPTTTNASSRSAGN